jgi:Pyridine nucleotide-disulphide oxidoreductase
VVDLRSGGGAHELVLSDGTAITARAVVLATGVTYRRLDVPGTDRLIGAGVFYGAAATEAQALAGQPVFVVGAANSAGQAALHLARYASRVTIVVRGPSLAAKMSNYLIREIERAGNIAVRTQTEIVEATGGGRLERLTLHHTATATQEVVDAAGLFVLIGALPHTDWLPATLMRDEDGYIRTGRDLIDGAGNHRRTGRCAARPSSTKPACRGVRRRRRPPSLHQARRLSRGRGIRNRSASPRAPGGNLPDRITTPGSAARDSERVIGAQPCRAERGVTTTGHAAVRTRRVETPPSRTWRTSP